MTGIDNETYVYRTETAGGAVVDIFHELHADALNGIAPRWVYRVVCECCGDLGSRPAVAGAFEAAASRAGFHAGLCTQVPQRLRTAVAA